MVSSSDAKHHPLEEIRETHGVRIMSTLVTDFVIMLIALIHRALKCSYFGVYSLKSLTEQDDMQGREKQILVSLILLVKFYIM